MMDLALYPCDLAVFFEFGNSGKILKIPLTPKHRRSILNTEDRNDLPRRYREMLNVQSPKKTELRKFTETVKENVKFVGMVEATYSTVITLCEYSDYSCIDVIRKRGNVVVQDCRWNPEASSHRDYLSETFGLEFEFDRDQGTDVFKWFVK